MKSALVCLVLVAVAFASEEREKRSLLGLDWAGPVHSTSLWGPAAASILGAPAPGLLWGNNLGYGGLAWGGLAAPAVVGAPIAAPAAVAAPAVGPAALVAPSVGHGGGNIGPIAGEAIIRGPSGTVHSPAIQAGLH